MITGTLRPSWVASGPDDVDGDDVVDAVALGVEIGRNEDALPDRVRVAEDGLCDAILDDDRRRIGGNDRRGGPGDRQHGSHGD